MDRHAATAGKAALAAVEFPVDDAEFDGEEYLGISETAREFDVTLRTLRFYEARGLIQPRREGMNRLYSARDRARLSLILKGKKLGFTLTEIRAMLADSESGRSGLTLSLDQVDEQLRLLRDQLVDTEQAIAELERRRAEILASA